MRSTPVSVPVVQAEVAPDRDAALERTRDKALEPAASGAELIVFPETWIPGYPAWLDLSRDAALWDHAPVKAVPRFFRFGRGRAGSAGNPQPVAMSGPCASPSTASSTRLLCWITGSGKRATALNGASTIAIDNSNVRQLS